MGRDIFQLRKRSIFLLDKKQPEKLLAQAGSIEKLQKNPMYVNLDPLTYYVAKVEIEKGKTNILQEFKL